MFFFLIKIIIPLQDIHKPLQIMTSNFSFVPLVSKSQYGV